MAENFGVKRWCCVGGNTWHPWGVQKWEESTGTDKRYGNPTSCISRCRSISVNVLTPTILPSLQAEKKNCAPREGEKGDLYSILRKQCKTAIPSSWRQNNKNCGMLRGEGSSTSDKKSRHLARYKLSANLPCYAYLPLRMHKTTTKIAWLLYKWRHKVWPTGNHSVDNPACSREAKKY